MDLGEFDTIKIEFDEMLNDCIEKIHNFCSNVSMVEFISYSALLSWIAFDEKQGYKYMGPLEFEYLMGVFLSLEYDDTKIGKGTIQENGKLLDDFKALTAAWKMSNSFRKIQGQTTEENIEKAVFEANLISTSGTMRGYSWYSPAEKIRNDILEQFNEYLKDTVGFDVADINVFKNALESYYMSLINVFRSKIKEIVEVESSPNNEAELGLALFSAFHSFEYNDIFFFGIEDISKLNIEIDIIAFEKFLDFFSVMPGIDKNENYKYFNDPNKFKDHPIIKINNKYLVINFNTIQWCLQDRLEEIIKKNNSKWQKYNKYKSDYLENKTIELFKKVFPTADIYQSLYYNSLDGKRCELDGLIQYDNCILLIEAKSGIFSKSAKNGGVKRLSNVLYDNIEYAAYQAHRAKEYIDKTLNPIFEDNNKKVKLRLNKSGFENIYLLNITMEHFAELSVNLKQLKSLGFYSIEDFPWSVSLSDLNVITDFIQFPNQFLHYIHFREKFSNKVMIQNNYKHFHELDLFGFYLLEENEELTKYFVDDINENTFAYNAYCKTEHNINSKIADFSSIYNEYYNKKLQGELIPQPKKRYNKEIYNMVQQLEEYSSQGKGYTNFVLKLLDLDNVKQNKIVEHIYSMILKTKKSKQTQINSMPYMSGNFDNKPTYGISIISGYQSNRQEMFDRLKVTCIKNRYSYQYTEWLGLCIFVDDLRHLVNNFLLVRDETKYDETLENFLKEVPIPKIKVPRNNPCPCGSGKKFKKCCGR